MKTLQLRCLICGLKLIWKYLSEEKRKEIKSDVNFQIIKLMVFGDRKSNQKILFELRKLDIWLISH